MALIHRCWCGSDAFSPVTLMHGVPTRVCNQCGTVHQDVDMDEADLGAFYALEYADAHQEAIGAEPYRARYRRDRETAAIRLDRWASLGWRWPAGLPVLDVGAGNNALVDHMLGEGIDAWGVDLDEGSADAPRRYTESLGSVMFPTERFGLVTMLDSLEHMVDPMAAVREAFRVLRAAGRLIVDIPHFWHHEAGAKHWRPVQHLWMWDPRQLADMLTAAGFVDLATDYPIPGKLVVTAKKPVVKRVSFVMLPGMGDIYWSLVKLRGFMEARHPGAAEPAIFLWDMDGRRRSDSYLERVPWVHFAGHVAAPADRDFAEVYFQRKRWLIPDKIGCDYLMAFNGWLREGGTLDEAAPEIPSDWHFPLHQPLAEREAIERWAARRPRHLMVYVSGHGMFANWIKAWGLRGCAEYVQTVAARTATTPVFTGSVWDAEVGTAIAGMVPGALNLIGKTTMDDLFAIMRTAKGVIGWCGGNTIQAVRLGIPTQIVWSRYFRDERFYVNACPPNSPHYQAVQIERVRPLVAAEAAAKLIGIDIGATAELLAAGR